MRACKTTPWSRVNITEPNRTETEPVDFPEPLNRTGDFHNRSHNRWTEPVSGQTEPKPNRLVS